jgi:branched-chain amino acid transport system ATP-binding protein
VIILNTHYTEGAILTKQARELGLNAPTLAQGTNVSLGLAPRIIETIFGAVTAINAAGTAILMVEQNAAKALAIAHRADGLVVAEGRGRDLLADGQIRRAYLGH